MEIAILIFFAAIFGGALILFLLFQLVFRRVKKSRAAIRNFSGSSNDGGSASDNYPESDDDPDAFYAGGALLANADSEDRTGRETAQDYLPQSEITYSQESAGASAAPLESSYTETSYSSYDSGSSSDSSSSSSDSGSSSSD